MSAKALYLKYRPQTFEEVQGQEHITQTLRNQLKLGRIAHAYLFTGPRGTGKTSTARIFAKAVNCLATDDESKPDNTCAICVEINQDRLLDLIEIDAASNTSVEDVRDLRDKIEFRPNEARYKVYIIDEAHMLSNSAFNALLKTLEEPPPHVIFVLATTEPNRLPATITSRCQRFDFRRGSLFEITARLKSIAEAEGLTVEKDALEYISRLATGSFRDATSLLDQLTAYGADTISLAQVQRVLGSASLQALTEITTSLTAHDTANGLEALDKAIENGADPRQLARDLVEFFRSILLVQLGRESALVLGQEEREALKAFAGKLRAEDLLRAIRLFNHAAFELRASSNPMLPLEMALVEANLEPASSSSPIQPGRSSAVVESRPIEPKRVIPSFARQDEPPKSHTAPAPEDKPSRVVAGGRLTLETARQHWGEIVAGMRSFNRQVEALLKDSQPTHLDKENLSIGFGSKFHVDKMDAETKAKAQLEKLILEVFGEKRHVRYVISPKKQKLKAAESDPVISTALNLGGEITDLHDDETKE